MKEGENPPAGLILCAEKGTEEAHYALDNLPNKVLAAEYQMVLPDEKIIADDGFADNVGESGDCVCRKFPHKNRSLRCRRNSSGSSYG